MKVQFELREARVPAGEGGKREVRPVEYVSIHTGHNGKDVVHRPATEEDRLRFPHEYRALKPLPPETVEPTPKRGFFDRKK